VNCDCDYTCEKYDDLYGQQCLAIRIKGTMREFTMMNTLRELSS
jgi:hypothetical protein